MTQAYIVDAVRTPRGRGKAGRGALAGVHPQELAAQTLDALLARTGVPPHDVDDVVLGCVTQAEEQGANLARHAVLAAGWPVEVTATTLTRACGSGLQAVHVAAFGIEAGRQEVVVAGGVESMSRVPMLGDRSGEFGVGDGRNPRLRRRFYQVPQGISADLIATLEGFGREEVDAFALRSQQHAAAAQAECRFSRSLVPVRDPDSGAILLDRDEGPRPTTAEGLAALAPSFAAVGATRVDGDGPTLDEIATTCHPVPGGIRHVHTAGSSSGLADGAAAVLLASADYAGAHGLRPRARLRAMTTAGADPILMLTAPTPAARRALAAAGMEAGDIDLWEINEAFAAVPLKTIRDLAIDPDRVNVNGGAIALGHPLGATGAMLLGTAMDELERRDLATALVTLCIAGGQAVAAVVERV
ncbi:MAG TPA: acetyl-CoA C-acyltransferase [Gemmatimonadaceae bacterium]|nr:acetyl-CoA C-acyltransferase [Gemmatimonadaceae bacterium]